jgi:hypothetical protein
MPMTVPTIPRTWAGRLSLPAVGTEGVCGTVNIMANLQIR